jgi:hypothetical protein
VRELAPFWAERWQDCLAPPADAELRAARLSRDLDRFGVLREDIAFLDLDSPPES